MVGLQDPNARTSILLVWLGDHIWQCLETSFSSVLRGHCWQGCNLGLQDAKHILSLLSYL